MYALTFLKGIKPGYSAAKTFERQGSTLRKTSDYNIGATFAWQTVTLPYVHRALSDELIKRADLGWFHIYGSPIANLPNRAARRKVNFPESPTKLLVLDLDKYKLPPTIQWTTPADVIESVLKHLKLNVLADSNFTYVLTSSQLNKQILSAHIYFFLDQPVELRDLRRWAMLVNKGIGEKIIDDAVFRSVQPVYISPPTCIGFSDPFKGNRIGYHEPNPGQLVPLVELQKLGFTMNKVPTPSPARMPEQYDNLATTVEKQSEGMKKNWLDSVSAFVGSERGINKPAFRAAAQMVSDVGTETVRDNIDHYVSVFHSEMWKAIKHHGRRGTQADIDTYDENKVRNYIESALDKEFGKQADQLADLVKAAISKAAADGSPAALTSREILRAAAKLETEHATQWYTVRNDFKNRVGKLMPIGAFEKQAKLVGPSSTHNPIDPNKPEKAIATVVSKLTLIVDSLGTEYIYFANQKSALGYTLVAVTDPKFDDIMAGFFYTCIGGPTLPMIRKMFTSYLFSSIAGRSSINVKDKAKVGRRFYDDGDTYYFRAGDTKGVDITVAVTKNDVRYEKTVDLPIYWISRGTVPVPVASRTELTKEFGTHKPTIEQCRDYIRRHIQKFIACDDQSVTSVMVLACSLMIRTPQIYHGLFGGGTGTGKTYGASAFKRLFDPVDEENTLKRHRVNNMGFRFKDSDYTMFMKNDATVYDNIIKISDTTQAIMSQLSTGTIQERRVLFTQYNAEMVLSQCLILTSTGNPITATDLANRTVVVNFNASKRTTTSAELFDFEYYSPMLRHCWFRVVSELARLREELMKKPLDLHVREYNMAIVESIMNPAMQLTEDDKEKFEKILENLTTKVKEAGEQKKLEDLDVDNLAKMFIAFLESQPDVELVLTNDQRWNKFREWVRVTNGQKLTVSLKKGTLEVTINLMELPDKQHSFNVRMGASMANIDVVSNWEGIHQRHPARYTYTHKIRSLF